MEELTLTLPLTLQQARKARRLSQLELSMRVGVSQRHVSFVESGRARPSRELLMAWLHELDAPLAVRNAAMLQAGYAPAYGAAQLGDPAQLRPTRRCYNCCAPTIRCLRWSSMPAGTSCISTRVAGG